MVSFSLVGSIRIEPLRFDNEETRAEACFEHSTKLYKARSASIPLRAIMKKSTSIGALFHVKYI